MNDLVGGARGKGKNGYTEVSDILNNMAERAKLQNFLDEAVRCKMRIADEQESIKGLRDAAVDDLNIEPKMFNMLVGLFFNNNFEQKKEELEKMQNVIDAFDAAKAIEK